MNITKSIETLFKRYLPSPFTIAILLTLLTLFLALLFTENKTDDPQLLTILSYWEEGIWNNGLLVFAYQMMLILVLGHILVLSAPVSRLIERITNLVSNTQNAVVLVSVTTMLVSFFNWGLGLIFGAILARKVGEHAQKNNIQINYPLVGAAGYVGLMIWHGGLSGSAPLKVAETGHLTTLMQGVSDQEIVDQIPEIISTNATIFSWWNLLLFMILLVTIPLFLRLLAKKSSPTPLNLPTYRFENASDKKMEGAEKLDGSKVLAIVFGVLILVSFGYQYATELTNFYYYP